jgi:alpha-amylase/alpha-mannosidase (GH57 family)
MLTFHEEPRFIVNDGTTGVLKNMGWGLVATPWQGIAGVTNALSHRSFCLC